MSLKRGKKRTVRVRKKRRKGDSFIEAKCWRGAKKRWSAWRGGKEGRSANSQRPKKKNRKGKEKGESIGSWWPKRLASCGRGKENKGASRIPEEGGGKKRGSLSIERGGIDHLINKGGKKEERIPSEKKERPHGGCCGPRKKSIVRSISGKEGVVLVRLLGGKNERGVKGCSRAQREKNLLLIKHAKVVRPPIERVDVESPGNGQTGKEGKEKRMLSVRWGVTN